MKDKDVIAEYIEEQEREGRWGYKYTFCPIKTEGELWFQTVTLTEITTTPLSPMYIYLSILVRIGCSMATR